MNAPLPWITFPALAYFCGSIPFGLLIVRTVKGTDIRRGGSGNIGATNVSRLAGTRWAAAALLLDALKGALPTWAATHAGDGSDGAAWLAALTMAAAVSGHMYPLFLRFRASGKGIATAAGCCLVVAPVACIVCLSVFIAAVRWSRRVSAASLAAAIMLPPAIWFTTREPAAVIGGLIIMILIIYRHGDNIKRLANGREPPWSGFSR